MLFSYVLTISLCYFSSIYRKLLFTKDIIKRLVGAINCICMRDAEESVKKIRILEGGENRSSKTAAGGSTTKRCKGLAKTFKNMATTYRPGHGQFRPLSGVYLSSPCQPCPPRSFNCFSFSCVTTVHCHNPSTAQHLRAHAPRNVHAYSLAIDQIIKL